MTVSLSIYSFGHIMYLSRTMSILTGAEPSEDQLASLPEVEQTATSAQIKVATDNFDPASSGQRNSVGKPLKKRAKIDEVRFCG